MKTWLIVVLLMGVCLLPLKAQAEYDLGEYFPLDQGDAWLYATTYSGQEDPGAYEEKVWIDGVGQGIAIIFRKIERPGFTKTAYYDYLGIDPQGVKLYRTRDRSVKPFALVFPAQMEIGDTIESSYVIEGTDDPKNSAELKRVVKRVTLEGVENIGVQAGGFNDCLRFSSETVQYLDSGRRGVENSKIWLAPNIGIIKETSSTKYIEPDGTSTEKVVEKELKGALVRGVNVGAQVKVEVGR